MFIRIHSISRSVNCLFRHNDQVNAMGEWSGGSEFNLDHTSHRLATYHHIIIFRKGCCMAGEWKLVLFSNGLL